ncbi:MAG: HYR domain-containing protein, partial [Myxococcaceae bacterium]
PTVHYSRASGTRFPVGVTTVTVTATDASNNSDACEFTVEVQLEQSGPGGTDAGTTPGNLPDAGSGAPPDEVNSGGCGATGGTGPSTLLALFAFSWAAGLRRRLGR